MWVSAPRSLENLASATVFFPADAPTRAKTGGARRDQVPVADVLMTLPRATKPASVDATSTEFCLY